MKTKEKKQAKKEVQKISNEKKYAQKVKDEKQALTVQQLKNRQKSELFRANEHMSIKEVKNNIISIVAHRYDCTKCEYVDEVLKLSKEESKRLIDNLNNYEIFNEIVRNELEILERLHVSSQCKATFSKTTRYEDIKKRLHASLCQMYLSKKISKVKTKTKANKKQVVKK